MHRTPGRILVGAAVLLGGAVSAFAGPAPPNYHGKIGTAGLSMSVKFGHSGKPVSITSFGWDGFKCQSDKFTAGTSKPIKVTNGTFSSTQPVGSISKKLSVTVKGKFSSDAKKVSGTVKVQGCGGTRTWSAKKH